MMKRDPRHIHALMTSWITGTITQEEALYLKRLIDEDPTIKATWEEFKGQFPKEDIQNAFQRYETYNWIPAEEITGVGEKRGRTYLVKRLAAAAVTITAIATGWYLFNRNNTSLVQQPVANAIHQQAGRQDIALQLSNGETINLSTTSDSIQLEDARLNNAGKTLSYTLAGKQVPELSSMNSLRVPVGKDYRVTLSDGTEIWLNSATTLKFPFKFSGKAREIAISGEAYLKVARHTAMPFLVHTQHGTVQVLGTSFNINDYDSGTVKVALVEGAVRLKAGEKQVTIRPGKEAVYTLNKGIRLQDFDAEEVLSWRTGKYYFSNATLEQILTVLPRWYGIRVVIDNPALNNQRFAGMMDRNRPVQAFLDNLSQTMNFSYYFDKEEVLHLQ